MGTRQVSSTGASSGRSHQAHEHFHREGEEEGQCIPGGCEDGSDGGGGRTREVGKGRSCCAKEKGRLQALQQEEANGMDCQEVPPTVLCNFAQELAQLRGCVLEWQTERDNLRAKLQNSGDREDRGAQAAQDSRFTSSRFGSVEPKHYRQDRGHGWPIARFESSKWQSFQPRVIPRERAQYGLRGDRIGEAKNPGPPSAAGDLDQATEFDLTLHGRGCSIHGAE